MIESHFTFLKNETVYLFGKAESDHGWHSDKLKGSIKVSDLLARRNGRFDFDYKGLNEDTATLACIVAPYVEDHGDEVCIPDVSLCDEWLVGVGKSAAEARKSYNDNDC
jgi:hypothetical protein